MLRPIRSRLLLASAGGLACVGELPDQSLIEDTRILGIRAVPDDPQRGAARAQFFGGDQVRLQTLIVDPEGPVDADRVEVYWLACPLGPALPLYRCLAEAVPVELDAIPPCPQGPTQDPISLPAPCTLGTELAPRWTLPSLTEVAQGFSVELTLVLAHGDMSASQCARALLRGDYDTPEGCEYATGELGLASPGPAAMLNEHPRVGTVAATLWSGSDEVLSVVELVDGGSLSRGDATSIELVVQPPDDDRQAYVVPVNGGESFQDATETLRVQWLRTAGDFGDFGGPMGGGGGGGGGLGGDALATTWSPGDESTAMLHLLLRDERSGTSWASIEITR